MFTQFLANGIVEGAVFGLIALGFSIIYNTSQIFHFAHGAVYTFSAYAFYTFARLLGIHWLPSSLFAILLAVVLGMAVEKFIYYPLYEKKSSLRVAIISSLGIYIVITNFIAMIFGNETKVLRPGVEKTYEIGAVILTRIQVLEILAFLILSSLTIYFLRFTKYGQALRALADNSILASVLGLSVKKLRLLSFGYGSFLCGVASILVALDVGMDPQVGATAVLTGAVSVILGGVGIFESAIFGGLIIGIVQNLAVWQISARWESAITFLILLFILIFRPQGIMGKRKRVEEL
jgi:branched-chain amino acid transport system permease protein